MATFYKYAERSAESQVNWAEIGKDMTDMLREESALREQKKAALAESTRKLAEQISNAPQGESVSGRAEALRFADQLTQQMLLEDRLLRAGLRNPKDFMISRQNTMDGTMKAFKSMKGFQEDYGKLMDGVRSGKTSILKVKSLEKIQGYGNWNQSGFFIDSPTGIISAGLKEEQIIDGQKVIGLKPGSSVGMEYLLGGVYGEFNKYDYRADIKQLSDSLGEEIKVYLDPATMSKLGSAKTVSDLRQRIIKIANEDPTKEKELFGFLNAMEQALNGYLVNDFSTASLLADTIGDEWTDDPEEAKKNPNTVLEVIDPNTGQAKYQITEANKTKALDFMMQQFLGTINVKESVQGMGQVQLQERRAKTAAEIGQEDAEANATNVAENLIFATTGDANQSDSGTKFLTGLTGLPFKKLKDGISITNEDGNLQTFKLRADGKTLADPLGFIKSFIGPITRKTGLNQDDILREVKRLLPQGAQLNETTVASGFDEMISDGDPLTAFTKAVDANMDEPTVATNIQSYKNAANMATYLNDNVAPNLGLDISFSNGLMSYGQSIYVAVGKEDSENFPIGDASKNKLAMRKMKQFIIDKKASGTIPEEKAAAAEAALRNMKLPNGSSQGGLNADNIVNKPK